MNLLSQIYRFFATLHRDLYENGTLKKIKLNRPVFSIGNLSMGGSGKTPLTLFLYDELIKKNIKPAIICRSYNASLQQSQIVPEGADPKIYGDEAVFYKLKRPSAVVISGPIKLESARVADLDDHVDVILVDDGFQHHKLQKSWNGVVIDLSASQTENRLLPLGRFREPWETLKYSSAVFLSRSEFSQGNETENRVNEVAAQIPCFKIESQLNLLNLKGKKYILVSAIGSPQQFFKQMNKQFSNCEFIELYYPDHYHYTQDDINRIEKKVNNESIDQILCTEKDYVKIKRLNFNSTLWQSVEQQIQVTPQEKWNLYFDKICQDLIN